MDTQTATTQSTNFSYGIDLTSVKVPYVIKDQILLSPGKWNNVVYTAEAISNAFINSTFDKTTQALYLDHVDTGVRTWIGIVENIRLNGSDAIGDLVIVDEDSARKVEFARKTKMNFGTSAKLFGFTDAYGKIYNSKFLNFSLVFDPACRTAIINSNQNQTVEILKQNVIALDENYQHYIDESGNICRVLLNKNGGGVIMPEIISAPQSIDAGSATKAEFEAMRKDIASMSEAVKLLSAKEAKGTEPSDADKRVIELEKQIKELKTQYDKPAPLSVPSAIGADSDGIIEVTLEDLDKNFSRLTKLAEKGQLNMPGGFITMTTDDAKVMNV